MRGKAAVNFAAVVIIAAVVFIGLLRKTAVYDEFIEGARSGMKITARIFPALAAIMTAAAMLRASGLIDIICSIIAPVTNMLGIPPEAVPLALLRPVSGSGSLGLLSDALNTYGADSYIGRFSSIIMGSTETTFYCLCVYFSKTRVKFTASVAACALIGDAAGIAAAAFIMRLWG